MLRRDLLKNEIEQLGKVLAKILSELVTAKSAGLLEEGIEASQESLVSEVDVDPAVIMTLSGESLQSYLQSKNVPAEHLDILAEIVIELGKSEDDNGLSRNKKALELIEIADRSSQIFSSSRFELQKKIEASIE